jgi:hypothetical protein
MNCPVCKSKLEITEYRNIIFDELNYYCKTCESYHIVKEVDTSKYYAEEYHRKFSYNNFFSKLINKLSLVSNRTAGRFDFLNKYGNITENMNFLEIGGTFGEFFNIARKKIHPKLYTIVEPDRKFNRKRRNLKFENNIFENIDIQTLVVIDIVQMFHVFEHIFEINNFLERLKLLKPCKFYFEVPNCSNEKIKTESLINNPHYHHFSKKSLEILFANHKFEQIKLEIIEPKSYNPYIKVGRCKRYKLRYLGENEIFDENGIYLRGIYSIK